MRVLKSVTWLRLLRGYLAAVSCSRSGNQLSGFSLPLLLVRKCIGPLSAVSVVGSWWWVVCALLHRLTYRAWVAAWIYSFDFVFFDEIENIDHQCDENDNKEEL